MYSTLKKRKGNANCTVRKEKKHLKMIFGHKFFSQIDKNFEKILMPNGIKRVGTLG